MNTPRVCDLSAVGPEDLSLVGGKAAHLGELIRGGFPTPEGIVVTTAADLSAGVPDDVAREILTALAGTPGPYAVRSSATAEDLAEASFAGQQDSFLNVPAAELLDAVARCHASGWTERAVAYRAEHGVDEFAMAVVIQPLVVAEASGILFTADPTTGRRGEAVINATWGLGEAIVSGQVDPDTIVVPVTGELRRTRGAKRVMTVPTASGTTERPTSAEQAARDVLDDAAARELAALGRRIEAHFGGPQDIEWVRTADGFQIVQTRPITALAPEVGPTPSDWSVPDGTGMYARASIIEQLPDPLSPLFADMIGPTVTNSLTKVLTRYFGPDFLGPGDLGFETINGYAYYYYSRAGMLRLLRRTPGAVGAVWGRRAEGDGVAQWREVGLPAYREVVARAHELDIATLSTAQLLEHTVELLAAGAEYYTFVQAVIPKVATAELAFTKFYAAACRRRGAPPAQTFLVGFVSEPLRAEESLWDLAQFARTRPELAEALRTRGPIPVAEVAEWERRLDAHLERFGHAVYDLDLRVPTPAEDRAPLLETVRFFLDHPERDPRERRAEQAADREAATRELMRRLDPARRRVAQRLLRAAQEAVPLREDALAAMGLAWPLMRRMLHEVGLRLAAHEVIAEAEDVHWLRLAEVTAAGLEPATAHWLGDEVTRRRIVWRGQRMATPPGILPDNMWRKVFQRWMPSVEGQTGDELRGLGASTGRVTGRACVLAGVEDFAKFTPGDIIVAPITTPAYTPLFAAAGGVVTDVGGPLSHSSVVAREYGIPAVLGTGSATTRIAHGQVITVDGDRGRVIVDTGTN